MCYTLCYTGESHTLHTSNKGVGTVPNLADKIIELHEALIYAYDHDDDSNEDRDP